MEEIGRETGTKLALTALGLVAFGVIFNWLTERIQQRTAHHYTAELVVIGVLVTVLASAPLIGLVNALIVLALFVASGSPMIIGAWVRVARDTERAKKELLEK